MLNFLAYISILFAYIPGIILIFKNKLLMRITLPSVYFLSIFIFNAVGSLFVIWPQLHPYRNIEMFNITYYLILILQALFFYIFFIVMHRHNIVRDLNGRFNISLNNSRAKKNTSVFYFFWFVSTLIIAVYIIKFGMPPLFSGGLFSASNSELVSQRTELTVNTGKFYIYEIGFYTLPQIATILYFLTYKRMGNVFKRPMFLISLTASITLSLSFMHKTPIAVYIVMLVFAGMLYEGRINKKKLMFSTIISIGTIFFTYYIYFHTRGITYLRELIPSITNRIFGEYSRTLAAIIEIVKENGFYYGHTFINPGSILPYDPILLSPIIHLYLNDGNPGSAPTPAIGEGYANFGWMGVLLFLLFINFSIFFLQLLINEFSQNRLTWTILVVYMSLEIYSLAITSIFNSLLSPINIMLFFFIYIIMKFKYNQPIKLRY